MVGVGTRGIQKQIRRVALGLLFVSGLSSCAKNDLSSGERVCNRDSYISQSSEYRSDEGRGIDATVSANPIVEGYFGKHYNRDWLLAVGHASILETLDYVRTKGVSVYHSDPISAKSTPNLESTEIMPGDLDRVWRDVDRPPSDNPCGFLAGLYLEKGTHGLPSLRDRSAIIVREDAGRWTLVHEFMHHNFKTQATTDGYDDDSERARFSTLSKTVEVLQKEYLQDHTISDRSYAEHLSEIFQQLVDAVDQIIVQYQFEEVTIEATLQDQYEKGELGFVPSGSYANATWYIAHSKKSAEDMYSGMNTVYDKLNGLTATNGLLDQWKALRRYATMRDHRLAQLDAVIARRQASAKAAQGLGFLAAFRATPATGEVPCAHAQEVEDAMQEITAKLGTDRDRI